MTRKTREIKVGSVVVGGGAPVSVQTMATADPHDAEALLAQTLRCAEAGCDIIRFAVPDVESAAVLGDVRRRSPIPVVADSVAMSRPHEIEYELRFDLTAARLQEPTAETTP